MAAADSGLRRVAVHSDAGHADLALPAGVPVAALIASVVDLLPRPPGQPLRPYRLGRPGRTPLDGSKTLAQHGIRDGAVLVLTRAELTVPEPRFDDAAEQLAATVRAATCPWTPSARRLAAALTASGMAGVAGLVAVPGGPGAPNVLLAIAAAGTVTSLTVPSSGCSGAVRTMLCCLGGLAVLTAVAGMACAVTGISARAVGVAAGVVAVGVARVAGRVAVVVCGPGGEAHDLLTGLVAGSAATVVLGAAGIAVGEPVPGVPRSVGVVFVAAAGAALVLRARSHTDGRQIAALLAGGVAAIGIAVLSVDSGPWPAVVAVTLAGTAVVAGFATPSVPPPARRGAEVLESLTLGALVPLACWVGGVYGVARGLGLG
ncbi:EsaB/YukD family protein [[Mycobacterium] nativiensis]|uniref:EsaB/YukD family protein n=1 Tax=[Mycobacterium] nativiensis TaxID=2855503 RepID=A0ABU5Y486_9MYCO|nr:EsaB/YukD family protein [Mycolicibacter sp. MYC340]MEB3034491.1 EsaB/YukD family protein [Mycolicibacter sp. MYC340]